MASTVSALAISVSKPNEGVNGATMVAVVIMATVEDHWAVFKMAAKINGKKRPSCISEK